MDIGFIADYWTNVGSEFGRFLLDDDRGRFLLSTSLIFGGMAAITTGLYIPFAATTGARAFDEPYDSPMDYFTFKLGMARHVDIRDLSMDAFDLAEKYPVLKKYSSHFADELREVDI